MTAPIAQGPVDVNVMEQACENLAAQVTTSQDGLISSAITLALGEGWTLAQLKGRLLRKVYPDGVEIVSLDGTDVLELHPVRFEQVTEGGAIKIKAVQSYRLLRHNTGGNRRMSDSEMSPASKTSDVHRLVMRPTCHFTPMSFEFADDGCQQVEFWECSHCGHTKEMARNLAG